MDMKTSIADSVLDGITLEEIITTVATNEIVMDKATVKKVFKEILKHRLLDAEFVLEEKIDFILAQLQ
jgi:hypothetical protein